MDNEVSSATVRELIARLAVTEQSIRSTAAFSDNDTDSAHPQISEKLIELARQEELIITELRRRENVVTPTAVWDAEQPLPSG